MVIDQLLPDGPEPSVAHLMDLIMMLALGGRNAPGPNTKH